MFREAMLLFFTVWIHRRRGYMDKEYYTVNEVSEILNISKQAIYQRIKTDLSKYVINADNKVKLLDKDILNEFNKVDKEFNKDIEIAVLKEKLNSKDKLINSLTSQLNLFNDILNQQTEERREINIKLLQLIEQNNELNKNNQILIAQLQTKDKESQENIKEEQLSEQKPKGFLKWFK